MITILYKCLKHYIDAKLFKIRSQFRFRSQSLHLGLSPEPRFNGVESTLSVTKYGPVRSWDSVVETRKGLSGLLKALVQHVEFVIVDPGVPLVIDVELAVSQENGAGMFWIKKVRTVRR